MTRCVVDASVTLAWILRDESSDYANSILGRATIISIVTPMHWILEITNTVLLAERRGRITTADANISLRALDALPIETDLQTISMARTQTMMLARAHRLTSYDAAYLELCLRQGLPLATLNKELVEACKKTGVPIAKA